MTLLEEAMIRYPVGTKFSPAHVNHPECVYTVKGNWNNYGNRISVDIEEAARYVPNIFYGDTWAKIYEESNTSPKIINNYSII